MNVTRPGPARPTGPRILIVDDDASQRSLLDTFLRGQGFATVLAASGTEALSRLDENDVQMMISDVRMPGLSGLETLRRARRTRATLPVLLVTAYADVRDAVGAMRDGAVNYLSKPIDLDELLATVRNVTGARPDKAPAKTAAAPLPAGVIAESPILQALFSDARLVAPSESRVLISGESGAGKEIIAEAIHSWSPRSAGPFVKVNCAAIPEELLESELFGHEKGAFTGAVQQRIGRFEDARGGTIFLDEIGELSPKLQAKLLRITQDGRFCRVGSNKELQTDARILAATNRNLEEQIKAGAFREDLFYRINVVELSVPPLRERPEDILPLAHHFFAQFARNPKVRLSAGVTECLRRYTWPGNVRELRNAMERAALLSRGDVVMPEHLPARVRAGESRPVTVDLEKLEEVEREAILHTLRKHGFNRSETARALGISRRALIYKIQHLRELGHQVDATPVGTGAETD